MSWDGDAFVAVARVDWKYVVAVRKEEKVERCDREAVLVVMMGELRWFWALLCFAFRDKLMDTGQSGRVSAVGPVEVAVQINFN